MTDLNELAHTADPRTGPDQLTSNVRAELAALLRTASQETVGTEWTPHTHPYAQKHRGEHNADLQAARLAVAAARKERDEAIKLAYHYPPSDPYNPDGVTWRQMYEMLDEKSLGEKHGHACAMATLTEERAALQRAIDEACGIAYKAVYNEERNDLPKVYDILRPHATQREGTKADIVAEVYEWNKNVRPRQWSSTPPQDRSGKWWHAFGGKGCSGVFVVPEELTWDASAVRSKDYNLWLPYLDGDTRDTLPPLPVMAKAGEIRQGKPSQCPLGEARDIAIEQIARADAERLAAAHADTPSTADDPAIRRAIRIAAWAASNGLLDDTGEPRKILGTMPVTADGCIVGTNADVYLPTDGMVVNCETCSLLNLARYRGKPFVETMTFYEKPASQLFSTREAAERAAKGGTDGH